MLKQLEWVRSEEPELWKRSSVQRSYLLGRLTIQGFALIECYVGPDPFGELTVEDVPPYQTTMVEDFRQRHHCYAEDPEAGEQKVAERMRATTSDAKTEENNQIVKDWLAQDGRSHYRRSIRGRVAMGAAGMTGVSSSGRSASGLILPPGY